MRGISAALSSKEITLSVPRLGDELEQLGVAVALRSQRDHAHGYPGCERLGQIVLVIAGFLRVGGVREEDDVL